MSMGKTQKVLTTSLWALLVVAMVGIVATRVTRSSSSSSSSSLPASSHARGAGDKFERMYDAPVFASLTDQDNKPVSSDDLRGKVYIADFIFTHCAGPCPMMTAKMAELQSLIRHPDVRLVSFTVDPQRDTPDVLKSYAQRHNADAARWLFLTGSVEQMRDLAVGYKVAAQREADESVTHSTHFLLVDRGGHVVGVYRNGDEDTVKSLVADATELAERSARAAR